MNAIGKMLSNGLTADEEQIRIFVDCIFRYADPGTVVGLRSFTHDEDDQAARIQGWPRIGGDNEALVAAATEAATEAANSPIGLVFAPPVATFNANPGGKQQARLDDLANGLEICVELDQGDVPALRQKLEGLLGPATVIVASGGEWIDPETGEVHAKLHLHWRLSEVTKAPDEHAGLRLARNLAALLTGADMTAVPLVHPLRWPGSWHRKDKNAPRLCRITASNPEAEVHLDEALKALQDAVELAGITFGGKSDGPRTPGKPQAAPARVASAVECIPNADTTEWDDWNHMGLLIHAATGGNPEGLETWITWSQKSAKYVAGVCQARWAHFHTHSYTKAGAGTIFYMARANGWTETRPRPSASESDVQDEPAAAEVGSHADVLGEVEALVDGESEGDDATNLVQLEIARLIRLPLADYETERQAVADKRGIRVGALDAERKKLEAKVRAAEKLRERAATQKAKAEQAQQEKEAKEQAKLDAAWRATEARAKHRTKPAAEIAGTVWPHGIEAREDGLYYTASGEEAPPMWLCDPVEVLGQGRDVDGESWGLLLKWKDADQRTHIWPMPSKLLVAKFGELEGELFDRGFRLDTNGQQRIHLRYALGSVRCSSRVSFAETPGWSAPGDGDSAFVLVSGEVVGTPAEHIVLKTPPENAFAKMQQSGTLDEWKAEVAAKAAGNPVAAFVLCAALAGPLLAPLGESSGGFHLFGRSKAGKTLVTRLGVSVWGPTKKSGLLRDWRSTANGLENAAEECNDAFLTLDEVHQAEPKEVVSAVYLLANESGKQRLRQDTSAKRRRTWRTIILSNGELPLDAMAAKAGQVLPPGAEIRLPSVPIDGQTMWPNLHGAASAAELMASLQQALVKQYGTAIRPFLAALAATVAESDGSLEASLDELRQEFLEGLPHDADAQVRDVARRCALVALAGELAVDWGILPWKEDEATDAAKNVLAWWLERRGGAGATEEAQHVKAIRSYLTEFGTSKFVLLELQEAHGSPSRWVERLPDRTSDRPVTSRMGWRRATVDAAGDTTGDEFLIDRDGWAKICAANSADPVEVAKTLKAAGHLAEGDGKNLMRSVRLPGVGKTRCYFIRPSIFDGGEVGIVTKANSASEVEVAR